MSAMPVLEFMSRQLVVRAPYHPTRTPKFTAALKAAVPQEARTWNPDRARWEVRKRYAREVREVLRETLGDFRVVGDPKADGADYVEHVGGERTTQALLL